MRDLEGSKIFAKEFLNRHEIPTAQTYGIFASAPEAKARLKSLTYPLVLKADGLCAGKGVLVAKSYGEAAEFADRVLEKGEFGSGAGKLLIEEALAGEELSFIVLAMATISLPWCRLAITRERLTVIKAQIREAWALTRATGSFQKTPRSQILEDVVQPTMAALTNEGWTYRGFLYFGLMLTAAGPKVLEFNCRLGDPETQAIVARMDFDLGEVLMATAKGEFARPAMSSGNAGPVFAW